MVLIMRGTLLLFSVSYFALHDALPAREANEEICTKLPKDFIDDIAKYVPTVDRIVNHYLNGPFKGKTYEKIVDFVDEFGPRMTGSEALENSISYMVEKSKRFNFDKVYTEEVNNLPLWIRGKEYATVLKPRKKNIPMLSLGYSVGTPPEGITAPVIVVKSFEELRRLEIEKVKGKIVVYDQPFTVYGETVQYRGNGAVEAAQKGAVAALIRSVTPFSLSTPHTGMMGYMDNVTKIPAACITHEDADYLWREQQRNREIVIRVKISTTIGTTVSHNFIAERLGTTRPEKVVLISGHIDSWDIGDGAMDDAGGSFISWLAPIAMGELGLKTSRTVRTVLFTAEEIGMLGARAYEERHRKENDNLSFVMESDYGTFAPLGVMYQGSEEGECMVKQILKLFESVNATRLSRDGAGPDVGVWTKQGIPGAGLYNANEKYFWFHHTVGDTVNVLDSDVLDRCGAFWTAFTYIVADMKYEIPRKQLDQDTIRNNMEELKTNF